jgi:rod shape-determining protein MreB
MIVDIDDEKTKIAIFLLNGVVFSLSTRIGWDEMEHSLENFVKKAYNFVIADRTAEELKIRN